MSKAPRSLAMRNIVSSFSPEVMDILLRGSRERIEIPCPDQRTMQHLQMRLHSLRAAMRRENHPQYAVVTRARVSRTSERGSPNTNCVLVIQPNDSQFNEIFRAAGIKATEHTKDLLADIEVPSAPTAPDDPDDTSYDPYAKFKE